PGPPASRVSGGTGRNWACAPPPPPARPRPQLPARRSSTAAASTGWSNGALAPRGGSATSNEVTAGTAPAWTPDRELLSGAGTGYSPTTWSRSEPWPANQQGPRPPGSPRGRRPSRASHDDPFFRAK